MSLAKNSRFQFSMFSLIVPFCKISGPPVTKWHKLEPDNSRDVFRTPKNVDPIAVITPTLYESFTPKT